MAEPLRYERVETVILDQGNDRVLAVLATAVWPRVGDVIELDGPTRDAVVVGVRLQLRHTGDTATVVVMVQDGEPGDTIDRELTVEAALDQPVTALVEPPVPVVLEPVEPPLG